MSDEVKKAIDEIKRTTYSLIASLESIKTTIDDQVDKLIENMKEVAEQKEE